MNNITTMIISIIPILFSIVFHETAHAWMANKLGDDTAKRMGRITLNPIPHIDLFGTILIPAFLIIMHSPFLFGWAKPVPFNPYNFDRHVNIRKGTMLVALAGPVSNFFLAFISAFLFVGTYKYFPNQFLITFFQSAVFFNVLLGFFNLIPIPPLDGSKILMGLLPPKYDRYFFQIERWGFFILVALMMTPIFSFIMSPVHMLYKLFLLLPQLIFFGTTGFGGF